MTWYEYIKDKSISIGISMGAICTMLFVMAVLGVQKEAMVIMGVLYIGALVLIFWNEGKKQIDFFRQLGDTIERLDKKYFVTDLLEEPEFLTGRIITEELRRINQSMIDQINIYKYAQKEYKDFIEMWIHEIKTPLSAGLIMAEKRQDEVMQEELHAIQKYLEQALFYARSQFVGKDYIVRDMDLNETIGNVMRRNRRAFMLKSVAVDVQLEGAVVKSDSKWLEFIIQQIVTNALKYTKAKEGLIRFYYKRQENAVVLFIEDNGIGIDEKDLLRVFDKGYTGELGRIQNQATGIGLYLCKMLCEKLHLLIGIESKLEKGTIVKITFPLEQF